MDDWKPREHDHLVEPVFAGLGAEHDPARIRASKPRSRNPRALWIALALVGALVAARVTVLL